MEEDYIPGEKRLPPGESLGYAVVAFVALIVTLVVLLASSVSFWVSLTIGFAVALLASVTASYLGVRRLND